MELTFDFICIISLRRFLFVRKFTIVAKIVMTTKIPMAWSHNPIFPTVVITPFKISGELFAISVISILCLRIFGLNYFVLNSTMSRSFTLCFNPTI